MTEWNGNGNKSVVLSCLLLEPARMLTGLAMLININNKSKRIIVSTGADFMLENKQTETDAAPVRYRGGKDVWALGLFTVSVSQVCFMSGANTKHFLSFCSISLFRLSGRVTVVVDIFSTFLILARAIKGYHLCLVVSVYFLVCIRSVFDVSSFHLAVT